jgi:hypothetical protein
MNKKSHRYIILTPKYCRKDQRICDGRVRGAGDLIFQILCGSVEIKKALDVECPLPKFEPEGKHFISGKPFTRAARVRWILFIF